MADSRELDGKHQENMLVHPSGAELTLLPGGGVGKLVLINSEGQPVTVVDSSILQENNGGIIAPWVAETNSASVDENELRNLPPCSPDRANRAYIRGSHEVLYELSRSELVIRVAAVGPDVAAADIGIQFPVSTRGVPLEDCLIKPLGGAFQPDVVMNAPDALGYTPLSDVSPSQQLSFSGNSANASLRIGVDRLVLSSQGCGSLGLDILPDGSGFMLTPEGQLNPADLDHSQHMMRFSIALESDTSQHMMSFQ